MTTTEEKTGIIQDTKTKLIAKLQESGWGDVLKLFLNSTDFEQVIQKLYDEVTMDRRFTPGLKYVFRAFEQCAWSKTKVVIIGQDPYFTPGVADGIAFSCGITGKAQPSLKYMFNALGSHEQDPDLTRWANQGVLLLNSALTVQMNKPGTHYGIWKDFLIFVIDQIRAKKDDVLFVLLGKQAETFREYIESPILGASAYQHPIISVSHPASAAYKKDKDWDGGHIFNDINTWLASKNLGGISW
jgi:uracil-DNA glycosylase